MPRTNKKSRIRGLPPKVQLQQKDAKTGSFPSIVRIASDNRTGAYNVFFDDTKTAVFVASLLEYPSMLPTASQFLTPELLTTMTPTTGIFRSGIGDVFIEFTPGQEPEPFRDSSNPAVDGKSTGNVFYATGSSVTAVGQGFDQPLWSKTKIEINVSVTSATTLSLSTGSIGQLGTSFPMAYYNFTNQQWDSIGNGKGINAYSDADDVISNLTIGFGNTLFPNGNEHIRPGALGYYVSDLAFPYGNRYTASLDQTFNIGDLITEPFLLEKMVVEISGTWAVGGINQTVLNAGGTTQRITCSVNTCFLLNQRTNQKFTVNKTVVSVGTDATSILLESVPSGTNTTVRDIVAFGQVYSFASGAFNKLVTESATSTTAFARDLIKISPNDTVITSSVSGISGANWTQQFAISMSAVSPTLTDNPSMELIPRFVSGGDFTDLFLGSDGGRNGLGVLLLSGRGLRNDFFNSQTKRTLMVSGENITEPSIKSRENPYLLFPGDRLILGWQIPISANPGQFIENADESTFIFHPGQFKLALFGSLVREGKEFHDTLNQLLISETVHEVIE